MLSKYLVIKKRLLRVKTNNLIKVSKTIKIVETPTRPKIEFLSEVFNKIIKRLTSTNAINSAF